MGTRALFDNSAFAGVMRLYSPDIEMHDRFLKQYPAHRSIDELSLADFLTALCIYDQILLESSSAWNEKQLRAEGYRTATRETIDGSSAGWVAQLKRLLPKRVSVLISDAAFHKSIIDEEEAASKALQIFTSPLKQTVLLEPGEKIPNVYYAPDYIYRERFTKLNDAASTRLDQEELAQAMFLHRGLFLQSVAHENKCVYLPYHYRGKMLAKLPPMVFVRAPDDGLTQARDRKSVV